MEPITLTTKLDMAGAEQTILTALAEQGFGLMTEIDVAATFKNKIGVDRDPLRILGVCNPDMANRALAIDFDASLILPCTVVVASMPEGTRVSTINPHHLLPDGRFSEFAEEVANALQAAFTSMGASEPT